METNTINPTPKTEQEKLADRAMSKYNESARNYFDDELFEKAKCVKLVIDNGIHMITQTNADIQVFKDKDTDGSEYLFGVLKIAGDDMDPSLQNWLNNPSFYYNGRCWD